MRGRAQIAGLLVAVLVTSLVGRALAEPTFPSLEGRVVDEAGLLSADQERRLSAQLEAHERATTNQVVVVTLKDLQGYPIEEYGYQLARHWGLGQQGKDNGALLIVVPDERKVRIEVGYGLEGELTDAISSDIIHRVILPEFKRGRYGDGIEAGASAMIDAIGGQYVTSSRPRGERRKIPFAALLPIIFLIVASRLLGFRSHRRRGVYYGGLGGGLSGGYGRGGGFRGGGGFGGGGFGGGGGGFGGGGASGGW